MLLQYLHSNIRHSGLKSEIPLNFSHSLREKGHSAGEVVAPGRVFQEGEEDVGEGGAGDGVEDESGGQVDSVSDALDDSFVECAAVESAPDAHFESEDHHPGCPIKLLEKLVVFDPPPENRVHVFQYRVYLHYFYGFRSSDTL